MKTVFRAHTFHRCILIVVGILGGSIFLLEINLPNSHLHTQYSIKRHSNIKNCNFSSNSHLCLFGKIKEYFGKGNIYFTNQTFSLFSDNLKNYSKSIKNASIKNSSFPAPNTTGIKHRNIVHPLSRNPSSSFQSIHSDNQLLLYSAFLDYDQKLIRIVALAARFQSVKRRFCYLWYKSENFVRLGTLDHFQNDTVEMEVVTADVMQLPEHNGRKYTAAYVICRLQNDNLPYAVSVYNVNCFQRVPGKVSVVDRCPMDLHQPTNLLAVLGQSTQRKRIQRNYTVCVTPINFRYSRAYEIIEMIELNRILGAEHFTFYLNSVGSNVLHVLQWYQAQGIVDLLSWILPMRVNHWPPNEQIEEIHYFGQTAALNDCLNRHRGVSRFLVFTDLDEFIVPKKHFTWLEMMLAREELNKTCAWTFRCQFFRKDFNKMEGRYPNKELAEKYHSVVLSTNYREPNILPVGMRSKQLVNPSCVEVIGIHHVWKYRDNFGRRHNSEPTNALLHHYRDWENPADAKNGVRDMDVHRYSDRLLARLKQVWKEFPNVPFDIPLSKYGQV